MNEGSFLVSDGYCNNRIVRFNPDGSHHSQYKLPASDGKVDSSPNSPGLPLGVAHSLVLDECDGEVVLADRENMKVLRFDMVSHQLKGEQALWYQAHWLWQQNQGLAAATVIWPCVSQNSWSTYASVLHHLGQWSPEQSSQVVIWLASSHCWSSFCCLLQRASI